MTAGSRWGRGILAKMMIRSLLVLSLCILAVEYVAYEQSTKEVIRLTKEQQQRLTQRYADRVDQLIRGIEVDLQSVAHLPSLEDYFLNCQYDLVEEADEHLDSVTQYLRRLYERNESYVRLRLVDNSGVTILTIENGQPTQRASAQVLEAGDVTGRALENLGLRYEESLESHVLVYKQPLMSDDQYWGDFEICFSLGDLTAELEKERILQTGFVGIYSTEGIVVLDPTLPTLAQVSDRQPNLDDLIASGTTNGVHELDTDNGPVLVGLSAVEREAWLVAAFVPEGELMAGLERIKVYVVSLILVALVVEFLFLYFFTRLIIVTPIRRLLAGMREVLAGRHSHRVPVNSRDEFGELAESFNRMTESIEQTIVDLTAREREIEALNASLREKLEQLQVETVERQRAEEAQRQLEAQVRHAQKLESLGVLAGGIAHDFNNLLAAILGNADMALSELPEGAPVRGSLENVIKSCQRAAELCSQLLAYSGKGSFVVKPVDLTELVQEMLQLLEVSIPKKASLRCHFEPELPPILADASQLRQVVLNLITNAAESLEGNEGEIELIAGVRECGREDLQNPYFSSELPEGPYVYLEVRDSGCGMDEDTAQRVFDPFFSTKFTGRGLGMAAVLGIVRAQRGTLEIQSELGRGSTFRVMFPATAAVVESTPAKPVEESRLPAGSSVLVADDEPDVCDVVARALVRAGFEVLTARDGQEALEVFRDHADEIRAVVLDMTMPRLNGLEACHEIRRLRPEVPVILTSGYAEMDALAGHEGRVDGFVQKPYRPQVLVSRLREILFQSGPTEIQPPGLMARGPDRPGKRSP